MESEGELQAFEKAEDSVWEIAREITKRAMVAEERGYKLSWASANYAAVIRQRKAALLACVDEIKRDLQLLEVLRDKVEKIEEQIMEMGVGDDPLAPGTDVWNDLALFLGAETLAQAAGAAAAASNSSSPASTPEY